MKVRADIAALIRDGRSDAAIARLLGCDRSTVGKARRALRIPPAGDRKRRLTDEATGRRVDEYRPERMPTSPQQQAENRRRLLNALRTPAGPA
ncbi:helix-turn-helix domain-containing protein [Streptomyces sp. NPDC056529]|uniref:helix-turn-helix domain-containing protein n=1 Tax=Streptomyces sp. NPDC056529 TaxID=3345855 RepID=UPI0036BB4902